MKKTTSKGAVAAPVEEILVETALQEAPKGREITNIRRRKDGTYVVSMNGNFGLIEAYHVLPPEQDPHAPAGLWDEVLAAINNGASIAPWKDPEPEPLTPEEALAGRKDLADRVLRLMQMAADVDELDEGQLSLLKEWKRYRLRLETDADNALQPDKPEWIN